MPTKKVTADSPAQEATAAESAVKKKRTTKTTEEKTIEKKTPVKKAAEKAEPKKAVVRKPAAEKAEPKKTSEKKNAEPEISAVIQYGAREVSVQELVSAAAEAYKAAHEGADVKAVNIYIKPEENAVYYVVNGDDSAGNNKISLFQ